MRFTKMQGAGNDYLFLDCFRNSLPRDMHVDAIRESDRNHRKSGYRFGTQGREPRSAVHGIFDLLGDEFLDLLRGEPRGLRLDVDLRRDELGKHIQGGPQRAPAAQNECQYRERRDQYGQKF